MSNFIKEMESLRAKESLKTKQREEAMQAVSKKSGQLADKIKKLGIPASK